MGGVTKIIDQLIEVSVGGLGDCTERTANLLKNKADSVFQTERPVSYASLPDITVEPQRLGRQAVLPGLSRHIKCNN